MQLNSNVKLINTCDIHGNIVRQVKSKQKGVIYYDDSRLS